MYKIDLNRPSIIQKQKAISELKGIAKDNANITIINLKHLPDNLFQTVRKELRKKGAVVKVVKKAVAYRFLGDIPKLKDHLDVCNEPICLVLSNLSAFDIYKIVTGTRKKRPARPGDVATSDIVVPAGETELQPGPALSELKAAGINVQVKAGKIAVAKDSVVAKAGEVIDDKKASALQKLGITPFETKAEIKLIYDGNYVYEPKLFEITENISSLVEDAERYVFNLSYNIRYYTNANVGSLIAQAYTQSIALASSNVSYSPLSIEQSIQVAASQCSALDSLLGEEKEGGE